MAYWFDIAGGIEVYTHKKNQNYIETMKTQSMIDYTFCFIWTWHNATNIYYQKLRTNKCLHFE